MRKTPSFRLDSLQDKAPSLAEHMMKVLHNSQLPSWVKWFPFHQVLWKAGWTKRALRGHCHVTPFRMVQLCVPGIRAGVPEGLGFQGPQSCPAFACTVPSAMVIHRQENGSARLWAILAASGTRSM